ncbi:hypothetical protein ACF1BU_05835 [Streptomyces sp. NPDC014724]
MCVGGYPAAGLPSALTTSCGNILDAAPEFIGTSLTAKTFDMNRLS